MFDMTDRHNEFDTAARIGAAYETMQDKIASAATFSRLKTALMWLGSIILAAVVAHCAGDLGARVSQTLVGAEAAFCGRGC